MKSARRQLTTQSKANNAIATTTFSACEVRKRRTRPDCGTTFDAESGISLGPDVHCFAVTVENGLPRES